MLILIRGLPGSGKSTLAKKMLDNYAKNGRLAKHLENDMFLYNANGEYCYSLEKYPIACEKCYGEAKHFLSKCSDILIVSNCFISQNSLMNYVQLGKDNGHKVLVVTMLEEFKSIHDVPKEMIDLMRSNFWKAY